MLCANTEGIFRIIQSVPSPKAEPFKRWLAKVGFERVQEIEDPELATKRTKELYRAKGYSEAWIEKRMRGIYAPSQRLHYRGGRSRARFADGFSPCPAAGEAVTGAGPDGGVPLRTGRGARLALT